MRSTTASGSILRSDTGALPSSNRNTLGGWSIWRPDRCPLAGVHSTVGSKLTGGRDKSDRGMGQNWPFSRVKTGPLTCKSNTRTKPVNLTLSENERERIIPEEVKGKGNSKSPDAPTLHDPA